MATQLYVNMRLKMKKKIVESLIVAKIVILIGAPENHTITWMLKNN